MARGRPKGTKTGVNTKAYKEGEYKPKRESLLNDYTGYDFTFVDNYDELFLYLRKAMYLKFNIYNYDVIVDSILKGVRYQKSYDESVSKKFTWFSHILITETMQFLNKPNNTLSYDIMKEEDVDFLEIAHNESATQLESIDIIPENFDEVINAIKNDSRFSTIKLVSIDNLSYIDAAEKININLNTFKNKVTRERSILKKEFNYIKPIKFLSPKEKERKQRKSEYYKERKREYMRRWKMKKLSSEL